MCPLAGEIISSELKKSCIIIIIIFTISRNNVLVESFLVGLEEVLLFYLFFQTWEEVRRGAMERSICVWNSSRSRMVDASQLSLTEVGIVSKPDRCVVRDTDCSLLVPSPLAGERSDRGDKWQISPVDRSCVEWFWGEEDWRISWENVNGFHGLGGGLDEACGIPAEF